MNEYSFKFDFILTFENNLEKEFYLSILIDFNAYKIFNST